MGSHRICHILNRQSVHAVNQTQDLHVSSATEAMKQEVVIHPLYFKYSDTYTNIFIKYI